MIIISRTPVRISLFGGGTDYPDYYFRKKGAVLGTTINKYTYASVNRLGEFFQHKIRVGYSKAELVNEVEEILHPSVRECLKHHNFSGNLDIHIFSDLPAKTGLGSSSSFTVGFLHALYALKGKKVSKQKLAEEACFIEQKRIEENVGSQDQFHSAFGGFNLVEFYRDDTRVKPLIISHAKKKIFQNHLMLFYTGLTRFANEVVKEQMQRTKTLSNDVFLHKMYEMVYLAEEIISSSAEEEFILELGKLLHKSWELKKKLSMKISNPFIDQSYELARGAGAVGGKLCGAGSGGFLALIVPPKKQDQVRKTLKDLLEVSFQLENEGSTIIYLQD